SRPVKGRIPDLQRRRPGRYRTAGADDAIDEAAALLLQAARPVIFAGNGVHLSEAWSELTALAEHLGIPVATTLMGKGAFPEDHPLSVGMTGIWGTRLANETTRSADVILAIGTGFGEADCSSWNPEYTFAIPPSRLIQLDADPPEIGKAYPVDVGIVGDAKASLAKLVERVRARAPRVDWRQSRRAGELETSRRAWLGDLAASQSDGGRPIHPA